MGPLPKRTDFRPGRADYKPERADSRPERADFRFERGDFRPEMADFRPVRVGGDERNDKRNDKRNNKRNNERKSPCVLQDFVPLKAAAQKVTFQISYGNLNLSQMYFSEPFPVTYLIFFEKAL